VDSGQVRVRPDEEHHPIGWAEAADELVGLYRAKQRPESLADSGSIILKQKVEAWARLCEEVGFTPVIKLSRKRHVEHDNSSPAGDTQDP